METAAATPAPRGRQIVVQEFLDDPQRGTIAKLRIAWDELRAYFVEREEIIECMFVALLAQQHLCEIGPPGTAKSYLVDSFTRYFKGFVFFQWLLTKFSTPEELFGPYDLSELKKGRYIRVNDPKVAKFGQANVAFLDEVFNANSAILNSLLQAINERILEGNHIPLMCLYGATNFIPEERALVAFFDRFLFRFIVDDIHEASNFEFVIAAPQFSSRAFGTITQAEVASLQARVPAVDTKPILGIVGKIRELLRIEHIEPSTRRFKWAIKAMQARALLAGRDTCTQDDVWILRHVLWTEPKESSLVESVITKAIDPDMARIKQYYDQAKDIEKQLAPLDPSKDQNALATVSEGTQKLQVIAASIEEMCEKSVMVPKVRGIAEKLVKAVRDIHKNILKTKLGVAI